ncbi:MULTISPECIES: hypothetical protein [unclassified Acinetobacter]|uniref:hypothetical protein n=1 Tax=unclassified Acinetobacter TaxID=196816 RepID=UPI002934764D|nr:MULTISPECIES: hypothetical protein [unclassified Acinetobacter]WOE32792.1 hypothetical protein QSG84_06350 [Acinetobacter sp. SAAs470]WOE38269.1 hypothetical protein QSG86_15405 [Acinetobacter sp. SAAs474]
MTNNFQCHKCNIKVEVRDCPVCKTDAHMLDLNNPMDAFIANGGFDQAMTKAAESLPEGVVESLKEIS